MFLISQTLVKFNYKKHSSRDINTFNFQDITHFALNIKFNIKIIFGLILFFIPSILGKFALKHLSPKKLAKS